MAKANVRSDALFTWDRFKDKPLDEALKSIYDHTAALSTRTRQWYWQSIQVKRRTSLLARFAAFLLLVLGTLLPVLAGLGNLPEERLYLTQLGVVALAFAGLLVAADKVFGWSSGWLRYITTVTAIENLTRTFELAWAAYFVDAKGALGEADRKPLFDLAKGFEDDISRQLSDETGRWVSEFNSSLALLGELIKTQRESVERSTDEARALQQKAADAGQMGGVELDLAYRAGPVPLKIGLDDEAPGDFSGTSWARAAVAPGMHKVRVLTPGTPPLAMERAVAVPSGGIGKLDLTIS